MIKKFKNYILSSLVLLGLLAPTLAIGTVAAVEIGDSLQQGACLEVGNTTCNSSTDPEEKINSLISDVINIFSIVVGVVSVVMIIIGGFKYITSGGDSGNVTGAKNTIMYAIIGLVIVALAQVIVNFVLAKI